MCANSASLLGHRLTFGRGNALRAVWTVGDSCTLLSGDASARIWTSAPRLVAVGAPPLTRCGGLGGVTSEDFFEDRLELLSLSLPLTLTASWPPPSTASMLSSPPAQEGLTATPPAQDQEGLQRSTKLEYSDRRGVVLSRGPA